MVRERIIEVGVKRDYVAAESRQHLRCERARRAVAASGDHLQLAGEWFAPRKAVHVTLADIRVKMIRASWVGAISAFQNNDSQRGHFIGAERQWPRHPHLDAGPAVVVMARRYHGHAFDIQGELREVRHGRQRKPDVVNLGPAREHARDERVLDARRIGPVIVARHDADGYAALPHQRRHGHADRLQAHEIHFLREEPARVVLPKPGRLHEGEPFKIGRVRREIRSRRRKAVVVGNGGHVLLRESHDAVS